MFYPLNNLFKAFDGKGLRAYQLRTGQMRLPVRAAKPIELQYKPTVEALSELPQEPAVGKFYMYRGQKVLCISRPDCDVCIRSGETSCDDYPINCSQHERADGKSVQFLPVD